MSVKDIGIPGITAPTAKECNDLTCPFHGNTRIRGKITQGVIVSKKSSKTVIIRRDYVQFVKKYQRYERRNSRMACHLPECLRNVVDIGHLVTVGESRKISKTKAFIVLGKVKKRGES